MARYSAQFRNTVLPKLFPPESRSATELRRKDKALAEMAAIVTLQKKTELLFQDREDD